MTRINVVGVEELSKEHAFGEYKEILRPFNKVKKALAKYPNKWMFYKNYQSKMPSDYTMGTGHETFFFDKLMYIAKRYQELCKWRQERGYKYTQISVQELTEGLPEFVLGDYAVTDNALQVNRERLQLRLSGVRE